MTVLAIVNPATLVGEELRQGLERRTGLWSELRLLATEQEAVGAVSEIRGAAALVGGCDAEALAGVELAFFCGRAAGIRGALADLPEASTAIVLAPDASAADGPPIVAGVNLGAVRRGGALVSPHPAAIALAHLLHPLRAFGVDEAVAVVVQPASVRDQPGLDELFEQTRAILSFQTHPPHAVFGHQLAFNLLPAGVGSATLVEPVRAVLGEDLPLAAHALQGGFFHSLAVSLYVRVREDPGTGGLRDALQRHPFLRAAADAEFLGPIEGAAQEEVLLGAITRDPRRAGGYWLWSVMDNLTRGGASNALDIAEAVLQSG